MEFDKFIPVRVGDKHEVKIMSQGEKGDGIVKINGYIVFVPEAEASKKYNIEITKTFPRFGFGKVLNEVD
ncbi:MAG: TRAM domain-containing protein [Nanoarchaeota archaeon]|nr:TRAM domain-containing protein [Nanoarchaeota archaeon]